MTTRAAIKDGVAEGRRLAQLRDGAATIAGFKAMLWLRKGFGFACDWTVRRQSELLAFCFGLQKVNEA